MRNLLIALSTLVALASSAQDKKELFVSIACRVDADEVRFVYDADEQVLPAGIVVVRVVTLQKTESRRSFADLTPIELKRLRKQARKARSCEIVVINDYKRPPGSKIVSEEMEARMQQEIRFYMVQRTRPCPECPTASN